MVKAKEIVDVVRASAGPIALTEVASRVGVRMTKAGLVPLTFWDRMNLLCGWGAGLSRHGIVSENLDGTYACRRYSYLAIRPGQFRAWLGAQRHRDDAAGVLARHPKTVAMPDSVDYWALENYFDEAIATVYREFMESLWTPYRAHHAVPQVIL